MKKIDGLKEFALEKYQYYDTKYDLPKDFTIRSILKFLISVKRIKFNMKKEKEEQTIEELIKSSKEIDQQIDQFLSYFSKKPKNQ